VHYLLFVVTFAAVQGVGYLSIMTALRTGQPGGRSLIPCRSRDSPLRQNIPTGSGAHTASFSVITGGSYPRIKATDV